MARRGIVYFEGEQLDLFAGKAPVRAADPVEVTLETTLNVTPAVPVEPPPVVPEGAGEAYLARAIARWELLVFLWEGGAIEVCAPFCGSIADQGYWRPKWVDRHAARLALQAAGYTIRSTHTGPFPYGDRAVRTAETWIRPELGGRRARRLAASGDTLGTDLAEVADVLGATTIMGELVRLRRQAEAQEG